jgi:hypothetical protein
MIKAGIAKFSANQMPKIFNRVAIARKRFGRSRSSLNLGHRSIPPRAGLVRAIANSLVLIGWSKTGSQQTRTTKLS